jgi:predicted xylose isomerase-like sugar epimerase
MDGGILEQPLGMRRVHTIGHQDAKDSTEEYLTAHVNVMVKAGEVRQPFRQVRRLLEIGYQVEAPLRYPEAA